jgi:hypothetical protein
LFDRRHPLGWLFYLPLAVVVSPAEGRIVCPEKSGIRRSVHDRIVNASDLSDAVTSRHIVDQSKFQSGSEQSDRRQGFVPECVDRPA